MSDLRINPVSGEPIPPTTGGAEPEPLGDPWIVDGYYVKPHWMRERDFRLSTHSPCDEAYDLPEPDEDTPTDSDVPSPECQAKRASGEDVLEALEDQGLDASEIDDELRYAMTHDELRD